MLWNRATLIVCVFGFLKEFRPSEPFISPYLNGRWKNFTESEINQNIYPVATYSNLMLLVVVFLLTDWLRYKPVIVVEGIAGVVTWTILPLGNSIFLIQISQFFYGLFGATEIAYYGYLYAKTEKKYYQRATSIIKSMLLIGKASSALISQVLVLSDVMDYHQLNYLTLGAMVLGTILALFLPQVAEASHFHRSKATLMLQDCELAEDDQRCELKQCELRDSNPTKTSNEIDNVTNMSYIKQIRQSFVYSLACLARAFCDTIKKKHIVKWSVWWALSLCGYLQVTYYMQLLWQTIINKGDDNQAIYHGFSNCANSLIGAVCTYLVGFLKLKWDIYGELALAFCAVIQGSILIYSAHITHLISAYFLYMSFRVLYQASSTIASAEIARHIKSESYALVFGVSTFVALLGQSFLTIVVIDSLKLNIRTQFIVYGNYYITIGIGFIISGIFTLCHLSAGKKKSAANETT